MKCFKDSYPYMTDVDPSTNQYGMVDFSEVESVEARYIRSSDPTLQGNPCIEALPRPRTMNECSRDYLKPIIGYDPFEGPSLSSEERIGRIGSLRTLRVSMPFDYMLEIEMRRALEQSYRQRYQFYNPDIPVWKAVDTNKNIAFPNEAKTDTCGKYVTDKSSSVIGFSLLGGSGTGKSSAIDILKSHYPQVIHHPQTRGILTQIVYLHVTCPANSNFKVLYQTIGDEIDKALGYTNNVYGNMLFKSTNPIPLVRHLIENFCIGIIIFDEIQEINFSSTISNSFANLVTIGELSGVSISVAGLEEAYSKMFKKVYTGRRAGKVISTNRYCYDKEVVTTMLEFIFNYQWFDKRVSLTDELVDKMFKYTSGRIDQLITLYSYMHLEYLISPENKRPLVDGNLIDVCLTKHYGDLKKLLDDDSKNHKKNGDFDGQVLGAFNNAKQRLSDTLSTDEQAEFAKVIKKDATKMSSFVELQNSVMRNVKSMFTQFTDVQIIEVLKAIYNDKLCENMDDGTIAGLVIKRLLTEDVSATLVPETTQPSKPKIKKKKRPDMDAMRQNLMAIYKK